MSRNFKAGDKVIIPDLETLKKFGRSEDKNKFCGKSAIITYVCEDPRDNVPYRIDIDGGVSWWGDSFLIKPLKTNEDIIRKLSKDLLYKVLNCECCNYYQTSLCPKDFNDGICKEGTIEWLERLVNSDAEI